MQFSYIFLINFNFCASDSGNGMLMINHKTEKTTKDKMKFTFKYQRCQNVYRPFSLEKYLYFVSPFDFVTVAHLFLLYVSSKEKKHTSQGQIPCN